MAGAAGRPHLTGAGHLAAAVSPPAVVPPTAPPEAGGFSGNSPLANSLTAKRKRLSEVSQQTHSTTKRLKPPIAGKQLSSPMVTRSPVVTRSQMLRLPVYPVVAQASRSPTFPAASPGTEEMSISPATSLSPPVEEGTGAAHPISQNKAPRKPRMLRSTIWKDIDPIYESGRVAKGRCKHCYEVFSAARNSGTSHLRRHLSACELRLKMHETVENLQSSVLPTELALLTNWKYDRCISGAEERSISPPTSPSPHIEEGTGAAHPISHDQAPRKLRMLRSTIWKDIDPIYEDGKVVKGRCKHCYEVFSAARNSGTSHIRRHLRVCEPRLKMHEMVENLESSVLPTESPVLTNWKFDRYITRCELIRMIVLHELPFSFVEYDGFRSYSASLNPSAERVSRTTIEENCLEAYKNQKSKLRETFEGSHCRFSLIADLCTSNQNTGYICVTCQYIDAEWKVQTKIIRFCVIKTPYDASDIYSVMLRTIQIYNLEDKLFSITLDNTSVNKSMIDLLQSNLLTRRMLHCDGDLFHVRCAAQFLNLIVKDGFQEIDGVVKNIRESMKFIRASQSRMDKFEDIIKEMGIHCGNRPTLDVSTHWNSTCDMLESALPFKDVFHALGEQDPNYLYSPSPEEWQRVEVVCNLLKVFKKATEVVSSSKYPTSNLYFHEIWSVRQVLEEAESSINTAVSAMVSGMKKKFQEYWEISYLINCIPVILDPRFKFGFIEFRLRQAYGNHAGVHIVKVDKTIRSLFNGYSSQMGHTFSSSAQENDTVAAAKSHSWSDWSQLMSSRSNQVTSELDRYLQDDLVPCDDDNFDILLWWKMHTAKYPIVACMARDVLAVPALVVASESAFGTSRRIINDHRTRLAGNTAEALICFQDWLRASGSSYLDMISIANPESNIEDFD